VQAGARVTVHRVGGEVLELGQRLEAGVAAADEDVGEQLFAPARVLGRVGFLQRLDDVVAQVDRVGEALEPDRVLGQPRHRQHPRGRAERQQQLVVGHRLGFAVFGPQRHRLRLGVMADDRPDPQIGPFQHLPQRRHHVPRLQRPRGRLRQERRVEREVRLVDQGQPRRLLRHHPLQLMRGSRAAEATTRDHDVPSHDFNLAGL
jgi:hypothetical protein